MAAPPPRPIRILVQGTGDATPDWIADLGRALPMAAIRAWRPGDRDDADHALVWRPDAAFFCPRPSLCALFNLGAGVDALLALERERPGTLPAGVPIVRIEDGGMAAQMIDYATYAVLRHFRRFDDYARAQAAGAWRELAVPARADYPIAVLGLGQLGGRVAAALAGLGFPVRGFARRPKTIAGVESFHGRAALVPCLTGAKAVIALLPATADTVDILDAEAFARLADGALVVNLGRGHHLVEADLATALDRGKVAAAMLDVFAHEPLPPDHPFWRDPRVTLTPHVAALTRRTESVAQIAAKIAAIERGAAIGGIVDRDRGY